MTSWQQPISLMQTMVFYAMILNCINQENYYSVTERQYFWSFWNHQLPYGGFEPTPLYKSITRKIQIPSSYWTTNVARLSSGKTSALAIKCKGHVFKSHLRGLPVDFVPLVECVSKLQPLSLRGYVANLCLSYGYHCKCATSLSDLLGWFHKELRSNLIGL